VASSWLWALVLDMADDGFDGGAPFHLAFDLLRDAALLAGGEDMEFVGERRVVALVACIGQDALDAGAGQGLNVRQHGFERVAVPRVKCLARGHS
jgi:hypothetical protein